GAFESVLFVIDVTGGEPRQVARANILRGHSWLANGAALVYSSSLGSTVAYPPVFNLRAVSLNGKQDRHLTFGDLSYQSPDVHKSGLIVASRVKGQSNIWGFPVGGNAPENMRHEGQTQRQSGQQ